MEKLLDGEATFQGSSEVYRPLGGSDTGSGPAVRLGVFGPETWPDSRVRRPPRSAFAGTMAVRAPDSSVIAGDASMLTSHFA